MKYTIYILLIAFGCACSDREACYARNDVAFQRVVDECDDAGLSYGACPGIPEAEREQKRRDRMCP